MSLYVCVFVVVTNFIALFELNLLTFIYFLCRFVFLATLFCFVLALLDRCALANWNANPFFLSPITLTVTQYRIRTVICHHIQHMYVCMCVHCALKVIRLWNKHICLLERYFYFIAALLLLLVQLLLLSAYLAWPNNCLLIFLYPEQGILSLPRTL